MRIHHTLLFVLVLAVGGAAGTMVGSSQFLGAEAGAAVEFDPITLPSVVLGSHNDPAYHQRCPFSPSFEELVSGETVITERKQMRQVWRRLFAAPFPASQFDFDTQFVVLMGGGLQHPYFEFDITSVESFEATFSGYEYFPKQYLENGLAIVATTFLPGVPPPEMDPQYKVAAVAISRDHLQEAIFNRQVVPLP